MSNVTYSANNVAANYFIRYKAFFQKKINEVCKKLEFDDSEVKWVIYNPEKKSMNIEEVLIGKKGENYGFCYPSKNEIWISTLSINAGISFAQDCKTRKMFNMQQIEMDLLVAVMIDEITHLQTGCDHNQDEYEVQLSVNYRKLYGC